MVEAPPLLEGEEGEGGERCFHHFNARRQLFGHCTSGLLKRAHDIQI